MSRKVIAIIIVAVVAIGGGVGFALKSKNDNKNNSEAASSTSSGDAMVKTDSAESEDSMMKKDDTTMKEGDQAMSSHGNYITLADYNANKDKYADDKKVYFFHAPWCEICQGIDSEINRDSSKIPKGVTLIKTDYDSNTGLKKQYGVTVQYTFVQVDNNGNKIAKWSATNLDNVISGIQS